MRQRIDNKDLINKADELDGLAMVYETAVIDFSPDNYLQEFYDLYRIRNRNHKLIPSPDGFEEEMATCCGANRSGPILEKTVELFGVPKRVMIFEDEKRIVDQLEMGGRGFGPFFFIFYVMFCEYEEITLCFISGSNN